MARLALISLFAFMATGMFVIKNRVVALEDELNEINKQIATDQKALHVLKAEWTYLNEPSRIRDLSMRHAKMKPVESAQIVSFAALPFMAAQNEKKTRAAAIKVSFAPALPRE